MPRYFRVIVLITLAFFSSILVSLPVALAETGTEENSTLKDGIAFFQKGKYLLAVDTFINILNKPAQKSEYSDTYFWLAKTYFIVDNLKLAEKNLEYFLLNYKMNPNYPEGVYLKGRILFAEKDYESATLIFNDFIEKYADSAFISHAYFWIGESLFMLGKMDMAQKIFQSLLDNYPQSVKFEAAQYRISLINIKKREGELLKLLKMSHEELLKLQEETQKKIRTYEQAVEAYQKKLSSNDDASLKQAYLEEQIKEKEQQIDELNRKVSDLTERLQKELAKQKSLSMIVPTPYPTPEADASVSRTLGPLITPPPTQIPDKKQFATYEYRTRMLKAKEDALKLKDSLLEKIRTTEGGM